MKAIQFELSGRTAMFKKPDVNAYAYFTYNNIHKVALLGFLGAILGMGGYSRQNRLIEECKKKKESKSQNEEIIYPEFYRQLENLKVSILPKGNGYFQKKIQVFNNSVGYASKEQGGNLIVREQWLENPCWQIYILDDNSIDRKVFDRLAYNLLNRECEFIPYLGKNDHVANISKVGWADLEKGNGHRIHSVFLNENVSVGAYPYNDDDQPFMLKEIAPYKMNKEYNFYEFKEFMMTNLEILNLESLENVYSDREITLAFF